MSWDEQRVSFGAVAGTYDSYRPEWPAPTAAWLTGIEADGPLSARVKADGLDVLDLGAGTGKLTRTLVEAGHRVTAVDPSEGMLAVLSESLPQIKALIGTGEQLPVADRSVDVVTVAQAWHWMDQPAAARECARVLRPGGLLAIAWHQRLQTLPWVAELTDLTEAPDNQARRSVRSQVERVQLTDGFGEIQSITFEYDQRLTPESLAAQASSWSYVATHPERERVTAEVEALGWRVADGDGTLTLPHVTYCYRAIRSAG